MSETIGTNLSKGEAANLSKNTTGVVRVTLMGGETTPVPYVEGNTVSDYLSQANVNVGKGLMVTANGNRAELDDTVEPDSVLVVAGKVANG